MERYIETLFISLLKIHIIFYVYIYIHTYIIISHRVIMLLQEPDYLRNTTGPGKENHHSSCWLEGSKRHQKQKKLTPLSFIAPSNLKVRVHC